MRRSNKALLLATSALVPLGLAPAALANPVGASVAAGTAQVSGEGTATLTVNQATDKAIINWQAFNIGNGEATQFVQPSPNSVTLNRVTGGLGTSEIDGALKANGKVFLINPDGILFGPHSVVDVGGLVATTNDIKNDDFMAGRYVFGQPGKADASVVNAGNITAATGGFVALVAPGVRNAGTITARLGKIGLAASNGFTLDFYGDQLLTLSAGDEIGGTVRDVQSGQTLDALVKNDGALKANGGTVELTAAAARQVVDSVVNTKGIIEANSVGMKNGKIVLSAATADNKPAGTPTQKVKVSGTLSAAGKSPGETGGKVQITGEDIALNGATIDASGAAGGGTVLVGGDVSGGHPNPNVVSHPKAQPEDTPVPTATNVTVDATSKIDVSATDNGDGGKAVVWANFATDFTGTIYARGGERGGDGGFVEVSGKQKLAFSGTADTSAPAGQAGTLLLDPLNAVIGPGGISADSIVEAMKTGVVIVSTDVPGNQAGDIIVEQDLTSTASISPPVGNFSLALIANRDIIFNDGVVWSFPGSHFILTLDADHDTNGTGTVVFNGSSKLIAYDASNGAWVNVVVMYNPPNGYAHPTDYSGHITTGPANSLVDVMRVNNVQDLQNIGDNLNGLYVVAPNIDASATATWNGGSGFLPIGTQVNPFNGAVFGAYLSSPYDGAWYSTIDHLSINSSLNDVGLFGVLGSSAVVASIWLTNAAIHGSAPSSNVGTVAGSNLGYISEVYSSGSVTGSGGSQVGALVGDNYGNLAYSASAATVSGGTSFGLVGANTGWVYGSLPTYPALLPTYPGLTLAGLTVFTPTAPSASLPSGTAIYPTAQIAAFVPPPPTIDYASIFPPIPVWTPPPPVLFSSGGSTSIGGSSTPTYTFQPEGAYGDKVKVLKNGKLIATLSAGAAAQEYGYVFYVASTGNGELLSLDQIKGGTFPPGTFFIESGTGTRYTAQQLAASTTATQPVAAASSSPGSEISPAPVGKLITYRSGSRLSSSTFDPTTLPPQTKDQLTQLLQPQTWIDVLNSNPSLWSTAESVLNLVGDFKTLWKLTATLNTIDEWNIFFSSLQQAGLVTPEVYAAFRSEIDKPEFTGLKLTAGVAVGLACDVIFDSLKSRGYAINDALAESLKDTLINAASLDLSGQILDQSLLIAREAAAVNQIYSSVASQTITSEYAVLQVIARNPSLLQTGVVSTFSQQLDDTLAQGEDMATLQSLSLNDLVGFVFSNQTGREMQIASLIAKAKLLQIEGKDATETILQAKDLAATIDKNVGDYSESFDWWVSPKVEQGWNKYQKFANDVASQYDVDTWDVLRRGQPSA